MHTVISMINLDFLHMILKSLKTTIHCLTNLIHLIKLKCLMLNNHIRFCCSHFLFHKCYKYILHDALVPEENLSTLSGYCSLFDWLFAIIRETFCDKPTKSIPLSIKVYKSYCSYICVLRIDMLLGWKFPFNRNFNFVSESSKSRTNF